MAETPIREAAFAAIAARLTAAALTCAGAAVSVERNRIADVADDERPLLAVIDGDQDPEGGDLVSEALYRVRAILAGYVAGDTLADASAAANELHAKAIRALVRPNGVDNLPAPLTLADGTTQIMIEEGPMRVEAAGVMESDAPLSTFVAVIQFDLRAPWGNPFITTT